MDTIEEIFAGMENYAQFETFLQSGELSPVEMANFLEVVSNPMQARKILKGTLPTDRESYVLIADRFGIPTSTEDNADGGNNTQNVDEVKAEVNLRILEKMQGIAGRLTSIPENVSTDLNTFRKRLDDLNKLDPSSDEFLIELEATQEYLLGEDLKANE